MEFWAILLALFLPVTFFLGAKRFRWYGLIREEKKIRSIGDAKKHNLLERASSCALIKTVALHHKFWTDDDVIKSFVRAEYPIEIIVGPYLCRESYKLLACIEDKPNVKLFVLPKNRAPEGFSEFIVVDGRDFHFEKPSKDPWEDVKETAKKSTYEVHSAWQEAQILEQKFHELKKLTMPVEGDPLSAMFGKVDVIYFDKDHVKRVIDNEKKLQKLREEYVAFKGTECRKFLEPIEMVA